MLTLQYYSNKSEITPPPRHSVWEMQIPVIEA